jgi:hypothetical protein
MTADESAEEGSKAAPEAERRERLARAVAEFVKEFSKESDRAAVILVGARLEYLLGELLTRFLLPNTGSTDELLDTDRALGTFSARINAAHRLGLIDAEFARALHIFRRLRNTCAHETAGMSFAHGSTHDRVRELCAPLAHLPGFLKLRDGGQFKEKPEAAKDFFSVSAILVVRLEFASASVERVGGAKAQALIPPRWKAARAEGLKNENV